MYNKHILILILLSSFVYADNLIIVDTTENYHDTAYVYLNDNYTDLYNITGREVITLEDGNYTIYIRPTYNSIISSPTNADFLSYWWQHIRFYFFGLIFIILMVMALWKIYRR